jgi:hypothetical protein
MQPLFAKWRTVYWTPSPTATLVLHLHFSFLVLGSEAKVKGWFSVRPSAFALCQDSCHTPKSRPWGLSSFPESWAGGVASLWMANFGSLVEPHKCCCSPEPVFSSLTLQWFFYKGSEQSWEVKTLELLLIPISPECQPTFCCPLLAVV